MKYFLILFSFVVLFSSCEGDEYVTYRFMNLTLAHADSSPGLPVEATVDSMRKDIYVLRLYLYPVETSRKGRYFDSYESQVVPENPIEKIVITSSDSFDISHPAGANLNNYFVYFPGNYMFVGEPIAFEGKITPTAKHRDDYEGKNFPEYADLLLIHPPDNFVARKFYVNLTMKGEGVWTDSTSLIKLY